MSIRVQLWKGDTQIGSDFVATDLVSHTGVSENADRMIDETITGVHAGKYGDGTFRLECDHTDERGVFLGSYYRADITFPKHRQYADAC